jgi:hypothetical protein
MLIIGRDLSLLISAQGLTLLSARPYGKGIEGMPANLPASAQILENSRDQGTRLSRRGKPKNVIEGEMPIIR